MLYSSLYWEKTKINKKSSGLAHIFKKEQIVNLSTCMRNHCLVQDIEFNVGHLFHFFQSNAHLDWQKKWPSHWWWPKPQTLNCRKQSVYQLRQTVWPDWAIFKSFLKEIFLFKQAQIFGNFWDNFDVCHFLIKTYFGYFLSFNFKIWVTFNSNIWSHCGPQPFSALKWCHICHVLTVKAGSQYGVNIEIVLT